MSKIMSNQVNLTTLTITKFRNYCCCFKLSAVFLLLFVLMFSNNFMVVKASIYDNEEGVNNPATAANSKDKLIFAHVVS